MTVSARRVDAGLARRAAETLDDIMKASGGELPRDVLTRLRGLPVMLRSSGLVATLAFYSAQRADTSLGRAYHRVLRALWSEVGGELSAEMPVPTAMFVALGQADAQQLARATARAVAYAGWLSRLAEAVATDAKMRSAPEPTPGSAP